MTETALVSSILDALEKLGVLAWRQNSGVAKRRGYRIRLAPAGTPDIIGALPRSGQMFGIECKKPNGRTNPEQIASQAKWRRAADRTGVLVARVETMGEFWGIWKGWVSGRSER